MKISTILEAYEQEHVLSSRVVAKSRASIAIRHLTKGFAGLTLADFNTGVARDYGRSRGVSDSTVRRELGVLKAAVSHAYRYRRIGLADIPPIELPAESAPRDRWLTKKELARLWRHAEPRIQDFITLAYYTASRKTAIQYLTPAQVDLEHGRIKLQLPGERVTKKRRPTVPIDPEMRPTVEKLMGLGGAFLLGHSGDIDGGFKRAVQAAGLGSDVTPHILRHSRATHLLQGGVSPFAVAQLLGDRLETVTRVYGHHCPDFLAEVLNSQSPAF